MKTADTRKTQSCRHWLWPACAWYSDGGSTAPACVFFFFNRSISRVKFGHSTTEFFVFQQSFYWTRRRTLLLNVKPARISVKSLDISCPPPPPPCGLAITLSKVRCKLLYSSLSPPPPPPRVNVHLTHKFTGEFVHGGRGGGGRWQLHPWLSVILPQLPNNVKANPQHRWATLTVCAQMGFAHARFGFGGSILLLSQPQFCFMDTLHMS